jgi:adenylate cyclase
MKTPRRVIWQEALIGIAFLAAAWYAYYFTAVWGMLDYTVAGPMRAYVTGPGIHVEILLSAVGLGVMVAVVNHWLEAPAFRRRSLGSLILMRGGLYVAGLVLMAFVVHVVFRVLFFSREEIQTLWAAMSARLMVSMALFFLISFFGLAFVLEVRRKVGPGNLWALMSGRYHRPREETRTFLFLDLRSSTSIAERLGHMRYSQFIRQCFLDLTEFVLRFQAQIYQFVGDEVVLTWPEAPAEAGAKSLHTFFAFQRRLRDKRDWYRNEFGVAPEFRGGVESGLVTATEVGDIKREIAFHGDALNTAARLLELCREYDASVLVSGGVHESIADEPALFAEWRGEITLRGKAKPVAVYEVERRTE